MSVRLSMKKFKSSYEVVDILSWSKTQPYILNQQLTLLLSALRIKDEVYIQLTSLDENTDETKVIEEKVTVARCPSLHPGDFRLLQAVNVPSSMHMKDCIVFPQQGTRPHPNECSCGDLDGDMYYVRWDEELVSLNPIAPLSYDSSASGPNVPSLAVSFEDVKENFLKYVIKDQVGKISNYHMASAVVEQREANSHKCLKLAKLFAVAIDSTKTVGTIEIPKELCALSYPHFIGLKPSYHAIRILGRLYE